MGYYLNERRILKENMKVLRLWDRSIKYIFNFIDTVRHCDTVIQITKLFKLLNYPNLKIIQIQINSNSLKSYPHNTRYL